MRTGNNNPLDTKIKAFGNLQEQASNNRFYSIRKSKRDQFLCSDNARGLAFDIRFLVQDIALYQEAYKRASKARTTSCEVIEFFKATQELAYCLRDVESLLLSEYENDGSFGIRDIVLNDIQNLSRHLEDGSSLQEMKFIISNINNFYRSFF